MENENAIIKLTEELVSSKDELLSLGNDYARLNEKYSNVSIKLGRLIKAIINNTKLDYSDKDLTIVNESEILQLIKFLEPSMYNSRLEELLRLKLEETNKKMDKEAGENGK